MNYSQRAKFAHSAFQQAKRSTRNYTCYSQFAFSNVNAATKFNN